MNQVAEGSCASVAAPSGRAALATNRITPSPPRPPRRSARPRTRSAVSSRTPARSSRSTKSLRVPWPLVRATCAHLCDVLPCVPLVARDGGVLADVEHVELVVRHPAPLGDGQLGGSDVHPAVQLHGVGVDHLPAEPLRERDAMQLY